MPGAYNKHLAFLTPMKQTINQFKKSINESSFSIEQIAMIWDFYVTKSMAGSAAQRRKISDYGQSQIPFAKMLNAATIDDNHYAVLLADKMPLTLKELDFVVAGSKGVEIEIDIDTPRFAFLMGYSISDNEPPKAKNDCSKAEGLLTHIRNAFAHGNTYFFPNGNVLLEDKNGSTITAMILIKQQTLLDWIKIIDCDERYYRIVDKNESDE